MSIIFGLEPPPSEQKPRRTSYPYLTIAKKYNVSYGDVLRFVETWERWRHVKDCPLTFRSPLPTNVLLAIKGAVKTEYEERERQRAWENEQ